MYICIIILGSIFEESDQAQAIRAFQMIDPTFNMDKFMSEARTYIIPEVMEAYLRGDVETLKLWCSEAVSKKERRERWGDDSMLCFVFWDKYYLQNIHKNRSID